MKKLVIVGNSKGREKAPLDKEVESWYVNSYPVPENCTRMFIMDGVGFSKILNRQPNIAQDLQDLKAQVVVPYKLTSLENQMVYPLGKIVGKWGVPYFKNTAAYMIALAIYEGYKDIDLYGFTMASGLEHAIEKAAFEFWLGVAIGEGVNLKVHMHDYDFHNILKTKTRFGGEVLYGYEDKWDNLRARANLDGTIGPRKRRFGFLAWENIRGHG